MGVKCVAACRCLAVPMIESTWSRWYEVISIHHARLSFSSLLVILRFPPRVCNFFFVFIDFFFSFFFTSLSKKKLRWSTLGPCARVPPWRSPWPRGVQRQERKGLKRQLLWAMPVWSGLAVGWPGVCLSVMGIVVLVLQLYGYSMVIPWNSVWFDYDWWRWMLATGATLLIYRELLYLRGFVIYANS